MVHSASAIFLKVPSKHASPLEEFIDLTTACFQFSQNLFRNIMLAQIISDSMDIETLNFKDNWLVLLDVVVLSAHFWTVKFDLKNTSIGSILETLEIFVYETPTSVDVC